MGQWIINCLNGWWYTYPSEKYESQLGLFFPIYGKTKYVPNHQPVKQSMARKPAVKTPAVLNPLSSQSVIGHVSCAALHACMLRHRYGMGGGVGRVKKDTLHNFKWGMGCVSVHSVLHLPLLINGFRWRKGWNTKNLFCPFALFAWTECRSKIVCASSLRLWEPKKTKGLF